MSTHADLSATYRVNTPAFLGGADNKTTAEFRPASFKGALRFWWRTLMGATSSASDLAEKEGRLFGASADKKHGQSPLRMRFELPEPPVQLDAQKDPLTDENNRPVKDGARYLGYGVMEAFGQNKGKLTRPCLKAPFEFTVHFKIRKKDKKGEKILSSEAIESLYKALKLLGLLGGLGSKSRKGYGSLTLLSLKEKGKEVYSAPTTLDDLESTLQELIGPSRFADEPDWTAFSQKSRFLLIPKPGNDSSNLDLLDSLGRDFVHFRSWGRTVNGKAQVLFKASEKNFKDDHDLSKGQRVKIQHPKRIAFGLPHNYGKGDRNAVAASNFERRASPLFFHIHHVPGHDPIGIMAFLPSLFLPKDRDAIKAFGKPVALDKSNLYKPVDDFLHRVLDPTPDPNKPGKVLFHGAREVKF